MNLLHLKYAVEVERTHSITKAAENLFMGQPNLSRALKELERNLSVTLFKRTPQGLVPTQKGAQFLKHAKSVLEEVGQMEALFGADTGVRREFSVCVHPAAYITHAFARFAESLSGDMPVRYRETDAKQTIARLLERRCSLGIVRTDPNRLEKTKSYLSDKGLKSEILWQGPLVALCSKDSAPAKNGDAAGLSKMKRLLFGGGGSPFSSSGEEGLILHEQISRFELISVSPGFYMLDSPSPASVLRRFGLAECPIAPENAFCDLVVCKKNYRPDELDANFVERVKRAKSMVESRISRL